MDRGHGRPVLNVERCTTISVYGDFATSRADDGTVRAAPPGLASIVARVGTRALTRYWRTQRMRAIQATSPLGTLRLEGPPPIDLSSIFWPD